jgi:hypothetical protein
MSQVITVAAGLPLLHDEQINAAVYVATQMDTQCGVQKLIRMWMEKIIQQEQRDMVLEAKGCADEEGDDEEEEGAEQGFQRDRISQAFGKKKEQSGASERKVRSSKFDPAEQAIILTRPQTGLPSHNHSSGSLAPILPTVVPPTNSRSPTNSRLLTSSGPLPPTRRAIYDSDGKPINIIPMTTVIGVADSKKFSSPVSAPTTTTFNSPAVSPTTTTFNTKPSSATVPETKGKEKNMEPKSPTNTGKLSRRGGSDDIGETF